eukprot:TRINITY_DN34191_c0_g1_i1.p2 TRINITY_DN34191_c0_g1~~TRINITY_DN34191_c0_g1_i1.p2  ORF type:complete len:350 (+),score=80.00 TRINITY_DN34191_c0_g1_i1:107-1051(+)
MAEYKFLFQAWMKEHSKSYDVHDFDQRFGIWRDNLKFIEEFNNEGKAYTLAMNQYGDLTNKEFQEKILGTKTTAPSGHGGLLKATNLPDSVDWRDKGVVTPVKNQGQCGSCWAFSTTGSMEGAWAQKSGALVSLSEQQLVDCSTSYGNAGCNGGLMTQAFDYIIHNGGLDTEDDYVYTATDGNCDTTKEAKHAASVKSYKNVAAGDEDDLKAGVAVRPVSVAIDASNMSFQFYSSGVYDEPSCSSSQLDHGVLAVGYGNMDGKDHWIVKNSWGSSWGQSGYIYMSRNKSNQCGIASMACYPEAQAVNAQGLECF